MHSLHKRRIRTNKTSIICSAGVPAYKPMPSLGDIFGKAKGIVNKFECPDCPFTYIGESKRSWISRWAEHKPGVRPEIKSAIKDIAGTTGHETSMENAMTIEKRVQNTHKRLFLESLHSLLDKRSTNEHKLFPSIYMFCQLRLSIELWRRLQLAAENSVHIFNLELLKYFN
jgi:hypothetical protein